MQTQCPDCDSYFAGNKCRCGFVKPRQEQNTEVSAFVKAYSHEGYEGKDLKRKTYKIMYVKKCEKFDCQNPGTLGHSTTGGGAVYCQEHFRRMG